MSKHLYSPVSLPRLIEPSGAELVQPTMSLSLLNTLENSTDCCSCASEDVISSHQSHDRILRAHGLGHGHVFCVFLRDGVGILQPETKRRRGGVRAWYCSGGTRGRLLGLLPRPPEAGLQVCEPAAGTAVRPPWTHADLR